MRPSSDRRNPSRQPFIERMEARPDHEQHPRPTLLHRRVEVAIFQLRAGHSLIGINGHRVGIYGTEECQRCQDGKEGTMQHVLLDCAKVREKERRERSRFVARLRMSGMELKEFIWSTERRDFLALRQLIEALLKHGVQI